MNESQPSIYRNAQGQPNWGLMLAALSVFASLVSIAALTALAIYLHGNESNHTGFEPWLLLSIFCPTLVVGVGARLKRCSFLLSMIACLLGAAGISILFYLDYYNVLLEYDRWIARGMP